MWEFTCFLISFPDTTFFPEKYFADLSLEK